MSREDYRYNEKNGMYRSYGDECGEKTKLQPHSQPVKLQPSWEENNLPEDELNFKNLTMAEASLEVNAPRDNYKLIYIVFLIHGIGTLTPWNMFITADRYFTEYKFSESYIGYIFPYLSNFIQILTFCSQVPNVLFNWLNVFVNLGGDLTKRIIYSISTVVFCFLITVFLAMIDTSSWPTGFFFITMICVIVLNMANGVYQNTVFGMAAKLPAKYTGAIILGNNISGTFVAVLSMTTTYLTDNTRMAAIYYFITALLVLFICFDTYFALPLNRFYRHHDIKHKKMLEQAKKDNLGINEKVPYLQILKQSWHQQYNVFCTLFVTLCIFPSIQSHVKPSDDFFLQPPLYTMVTCFLTFNIFAMIGSSIATLIQWPSPKYLWIPVTLRLLYIPYYLLTNYHVPAADRKLPVVFMNEWVYWVISITMALSSGYLSSVAMMYTPRSVDSRYASTAAMFAGAFLITGIFTGILCSFIWPWAITHIGY